MWYDRYQRDSRPHRNHGTPPSQRLLETLYKHTDRIHRLHYIVYLAFRLRLCPCEIFKVPVYLLSGISDSNNNTISSKSEKKYIPFLQNNNKNWHLCMYLEVSTSGFFQDVCYPLKSVSCENKMCKRQSIENQVLKFSFVNNRTTEMEIVRFPEKVAYSNILKKRQRNTRNF